MADAFAPVIGQLVWQVQRGVGWALLMNFGRPHILVAEPHTPRPGVLRGVAHFFARRRVRFEGHWKVLADQGAWKITTANYRLTSRMKPDGRHERALAELDGQRLMKAEPGTARKALLLRFDLGATLELLPDPKAGDTPWSLIPWEGDTISACNDGSLVREANGPLPRHYREVPAGNDP
jgi:hypothetical protein